MWNIIAVNHKVTKMEMPIFHICEGYMDINYYIAWARLAIESPLHGMINEAELNRLLKSSLPKQCICTSVLQFWINTVPLGHNMMYIFLILMNFDNECSRYNNIDLTCKT